MFNLEQSVAKWRQQMLAAGVQIPAPLDELEVHLRDEIGQQMKSGKNEAEAFDLAAQKLGAAPLVQEEFNKIGETKNAHIWKRFEILILGLVSLGSLAMACVLLEQDAYLTIRTSGLSAVVSLLLLVWGGRWIQPKFLARARQIRNAIYVLSGLFVALWCLLVLFEFILPNNHFSLSPEQYLVTLLWGMLLPMGAGTGVELATKRGRFSKVITVGA